MYYDDLSLGSMMPSSGWCGTDAVTNYMPYGFGQVVGPDVSFGLLTRAAGEYGDIVFGGQGMINTISGEGANVLIGGNGAINIFDLGFDDNAVLCSDVARDVVDVGTSSRTEVLNFGSNDEIVWWDGGDGTPWDDVWSYDDQTGTIYAVNPMTGQQVVIALHRESVLDGTPPYDPGTPIKDPSQTDMLAAQSADEERWHQEQLAFYDSSAGN